MNPFGPSFQKFSLLGNRLAQRFKGVQQELPTGASPRVASRPHGLGIPMGLTGPTARLTTASPLGTGLELLGEVAWRLLHPESAATVLATASLHLTSYNDPGTHLVTGEIPQTSELSRPHPPGCPSSNLELADLPKLTSSSRIISRHRYMSGAVFCS